MPERDHNFRSGDARLRLCDSGAGGAVVLIHGWTLDLDAWDPQALALAASFRVEVERPAMDEDDGRSRAFVAKAQAGITGQEVAIAQRHIFEYRKKVRIQATSARRVRQALPQAPSQLGGKREAGTRESSAEIARLASRSIASRSRTIPALVTLREWLELLSAATTRPCWSCTGTATATTP